MIGAIILYSFIGSVGMAIMDSVGTVLVKAITAGRGTLAGSMDAIGDAAKMSVLSVASVRLTSDYGAWGWLGILPILLTGFFVTKHSVQLSRGIEAEPTEEEQEQESKVLWLEKEFLLLKAQHQARNTK